MTAFGEPYPDHWKTIASEKVIRGKRGLLAQVPPIGHPTPHWYGACSECGLCSELKFNSGHAFAWLQRHLTGHADGSNRNHRGY